jgi:hypothetical protein
MKRLFTTIILIPTYFIALAISPELPGMMVKDTVIINFGNKSKIMILVDDPEELKKISEFDLNKMLKDLSISVDTMDNEEQYLKIEDETGEKYLNDTSIVVEQSEVIDVAILKEEIKRELKEEMQEEERERSSSRKKRYKRTRSYFNFEFGMNNWLQDGKYPNESNALYTVRNWGSWYVALANTNRLHVTGPLYLDFGANISWYNLKFQNDRTRLTKEPEEVVFWEDLVVEGPIKSKLTVSYINATLIPVFSFGKSGRKRDLFNWDYYDKGFRIGVGGYVGYRLWSFTKYTWRESGKKNKNHDKGDFFLNNLRYGIRMIMGFRVFDIFVNYDLNDMFIENRGPQLNGLSFGIII